jgi:hypothetical protein
VIPRSRRGRILSALAVAAALLGAWETQRVWSTPPADHESIAETRAALGDVPLPPSEHVVPFPGLEPPSHVRTCCAFGMDLRANLVGVPVPVFEIGNVVAPDQLGRHTYAQGATDPDPEQNGLVYTCGGGWIDTSHVRAYGDLSLYLAVRFADLLDRGGDLTLEDEGAVTSITLAPVAPDLVARLGQGRVVAALAAWTTFRIAIWHELSTWIGYQTAPGFSERVSAFSIEDLYSDALGIRLGLSVALDPSARGPGAIDLVLDARLEAALAALGAQPLDTSRAIMGALDGRWWTSARRLPDDALVMHRAFPPSAGPVVPWRADDAFAANEVPAVVRTACRGAPAHALTIDDAIEGTPVRSFVHLAWQPGNWAEGALPAGAIDDRALDGLVARARDEMRRSLGARFDAP